MERHHDLAEDVPLTLLVRGVPHAHRAGAPVSGQLGDLVLVEASLSADAVHDLDVARVPRDRPQQPAPPFLGLLPVPVGEQDADGQGRVSKPHVAVVPVARTAVRLGQARRGCGRDAPGVFVGQRAQDQQRPLHLVVVRTRGIAAGGPVAPPVDRELQRLVDIDRRRRIAMRWIAGKHQIDRLAGGDLELRGVGATDRMQFRSSSDHRRRPRRRQQRWFSAVDRLTNPRDGGAVVEADGDLFAEADDAADAAHPAHQVRPLVAERHEIAHFGLALGRLPQRVEDEGAGQIAPRDIDHLALRCQGPVPGVSAVEERREECGGVEARQAQPVDAAPAGDQRGGVEVADDRVVGDRRRRFLVPGRCSGCGRHPLTLGRGGSAGHGVESDVTAG